MVVEATELSHGKFISILEDDDAFSPEKLKIVSKYAKEDVCYIHNEIFRVRSYDEISLTKPFSKINFSEPLIFSKRDVRNAFRL